MSKNVTVYITAFILSFLICFAFAGCSRGHGGSISQPEAHSG